MKRRKRRKRIPGRKTRRIVAPCRRAEAERAWRLVRLKGRWKKLTAESAVNTMVEDVLETVNVKTLKLLLKIAGIFEKREVEQKPESEILRWHGRRAPAFATVIAALRKAFPNSTLDIERKGLINSIFDEFAKYICAEAEVLQYVRSKREGCGLSDAPRCLRFLEQALVDDDLALRVLSVDCVRNLAKCEWSETIWEWAGPRVRRVWD